MKQAFLFITHKKSDWISTEFQKLCEATKGLGDCFILDERIPDLGYPMLREGLYPGSNHFILIDFFRRDYYDYYWNIEYDVKFTGDWKDFFNSFNTNNSDFITTHIRTQEEEPNWWWWYSFQGNAPQKVRSFNPIYRISNRALSLVDRRHKEGFTGHHEVLIPTVLTNEGLTLYDMKEWYIDATNHLLLDGSVSCKNRVHAGYVNGVKNKLFHPIKSEITELCKLAIKHKTDKVAVFAHHYTPIYDGLFKSRRKEVQKVLEFGIGFDSYKRMSHVPDYKGGGSLRLWEEYFPNATVYGADIVTDSFINEGRIKSFVCDQNDESSLKELALQIGGGFDFIVDDGSHKPENQIRTAKVFLPLLKKGGVYSIEDVGSYYMDKIVKELGEYTCECLKFADINDNLVLIKNDSTI
jgi:hypothetical protein